MILITNSEQNFNLLTLLPQVEGDAISGSNF